MIQTVDDMVGYEIPEPLKKFRNSIKLETFKLVVDFVMSVSDWDFDVQSSEIMKIFFVLNVWCLQPLQSSSWHDIIDSVWFRQLPLDLFCLPYLYTKVHHVKVLTIPHLLFLEPSYPGVGW